jgi:hypothetical protein
VSIVTRVNSEEMKRAIRSFFLVDVSYKDTLLFYFSGHGVLDKFGNHYLASSEIDPKEPGTGGYWFDELDRVIENSLSRRKVVVLLCRGPR